MRLLSLLVYATHLVCGVYDEFIAQRSVQLAEYSYCASYICQDCTTDYVLDEMGTRVIQGYDEITHTIFTSFRGSSICVDCRDKSENVLFFYSTKSREKSYSTIDAIFFFYSTKSREKSYSTIDAI